MDDEEIFLDFEFRLSSYFHQLTKDKIPKMNYDINKLINACKAVDVFDVDGENENNLFPNINHINNQQNSQITECKFPKYTAEVTVEDIPIDVTLINNNNTYVNAISFNYLKSLPKHIRDNFIYSFKTVILDNIPMKSIGHISLTFQIGSFLSYKRK